MGQYYRVYLKQNHEEHILNCKTDGKYTGAHLMEHSWSLDPFVGTVCNMIHNKPTTVAWVGNHSKKCPVYDKVWENEDKVHSVERNVLLLNGRYLVNHTKRQYLDFDRYAAKSDSDGWIVHPLPILTSCENMIVDDYKGIDRELAGTWSLDEISVEDQKPDGYELLDVKFI